ncbi:MAG: hypothetical protein JSS94_00615 [Bacteroidetes bacterium]|nr:hypothetical protein [Bacteroidota bacterium]
MKKLILGLCFTVGASASVFAGNGMVKNVNLKTTVESKLLADCLIAHDTWIYNACGERVDIVHGPSYISNDCGGSAGGIIIKVKKFYDLTDTDCFNDLFDGIGLPISYDIN